MRDLTKIVEAKGRRFLLRVEDSPDDRDFQKYEDIRDEIWGFPEDRLAGTRNLICESFLHEGTSLFIGAFAEENGTFPTDYAHMAGFSYGFVGLRDKEIGFREAGNLRFYSQYAGVRRSFRSFGLGVMIKEFQKEILLGVYGLGEVICTFDPLTGVNAYRNIHHFGMEVREYRVAVYPEFGGKLNRSDVPSDRFLMSWDLKRKISPPSYELEPLLDETHKVVRVGTKRLSADPAAPLVEVVLGIRQELDAPRLVVQIPRDFYRILDQTDVDDPDVRRIPLDWRISTREAFLTLMARGYAIVDFQQSGEGRKEDFYILVKSGDRG
jgi:predicted GNAT superfamily acetyltransferase